VVVCVAVAGIWRYELQKVVAGLPRTFKTPRTALT
jgi:hypothetical protein